MKAFGKLFFLLLLTAGLSGGRGPASQPKITDAFTSDEFQKAGLTKLSTDEIAALNGAIFRVFVQINSQLPTNPGAGVTSHTEGRELDFYDLRGKAVAYIEPEDDDSTIYLWNGKPVGYLDDDSLYGFNGKHLGWIKGTLIYDHDGKVVAALPDAFSSTVSVAPAKGFKQFKPFKSFKEFKPFKPFFSVIWSDTIAIVFFMRLICTAAPD